MTQVPLHLRSREEEDAGVNYFPQDILVIGITGKAGSGKDTFGLLLRDELERRGCTVRTLNFASALKNGVETMFSMQRGYLQGEKGKSEAPFPGCIYSGREVLQRVGVALREALALDVWIELVAQKVWTFREVAGANQVILITDVRFFNEVAAIDGANRSEFVQVLRPSAQEAGEAWRAHVSEQDLLLPPDTFVVDNSGTLEELQEVASTYAQYLKAEYAL